MYKSVYATGQLKEMIKAETSQGKLGDSRKVLRAAAVYIYLSPHRRPLSDPLLGWV